MLVQHWKRSLLKQVTQPTKQLSDLSADQITELETTVGKAGAFEKNGWVEQLKELMAN